ncbi:alpha/beta hydrolase [Erythrobacter sp. NFXS35]|uniref:alpha/beta hydrolase n=1 Tax=Erythrobacter sp. NFXS35 TaxID=2818436 RepID=UPI0032DE6759
MPLEQVAPIRAGLMARRAAPTPPVEARRAGFEAQMAALPVDPEVTVTRIDLGGVPALRSRHGEDTGRMILWLHGGAFVLGSAQSYRPFAARLARACGCDVIVPDYRRAPEHTFPAAHDDAVAALDALVAAGYAMKQVAIGGDSCGANLALAAVQQRLARSAAVPAALWLISPYCDLTHSGGSITARAAADPFIDPSGMDDTARTYLGDADAADPRASPLFGPVAGLPPALIQIGSDEVLFDDAARLHGRIEAAGGRAVFQEWAGMIHVWPLFAHAIDEGGWAITQGGNFLGQIWSPVAPSG